MRTKNFPGKRERRYLRAQMPTGHKTEPEINPDILATRTKKRRTQTKGK